MVRPATAENMLLLEGGGGQTQVRCLPLVTAPISQTKKVVQLTKTNNRYMIHDNNRTIVCVFVVSCSVAGLTLTRPQEVQASLHPIRTVTVSLIPGQSAAAESMPLLEGPGTESKCDSQCYQLDQCLEKKMFTVIDTINYYLCL